MSAPVVATDLHRVRTHVGIGSRFGRQVDRGPLLERAHAGDHQPRPGVRGVTARAGDLALEHAKKKAEERR